MYRLNSPAIFHTFRRFSTTNTDKIVTSVIFERLPVVVPKIDPAIYAFQQFSFRWKKQFQQDTSDEVKKKPEPKGKGEHKVDYQPTPRITEADKTNDKRSLQRALDRRLYLLLHGPFSASPNDEAVWHFPEKPYENEETLRKCAESALKSVLGDLSHSHFEGNAPVGHMATSEESDSTPMKRFFFKSQVAGSDELDISGCNDYMWVTKDELLEHFPKEAEYLNQMITS